MGGSLSWCHLPYLLVYKSHFFVPEINLKVGGATYTRGSEKLKMPSETNLQIEDAAIPGKGAAILFITPALLKCENNKRNSLTMPTVC